MGVRLSLLPLHSLDGMEGTCGVDRSLLGTQCALGDWGGVRLLYLPLLEEPPDVATGPVLKTGEVQALGGSTPSSSAR